MKPTIVLRGAWATISGEPEETLDSVCSAFEPTARFTMAFKEGRWDGVIPLYSGKQFPAGLVGHMVAYLRKEHGVEPVVIDKQDFSTGDLDRFTPTFLSGAGITLRDYQYEACLAGLRARNGVIRAPTGSGKTFMIAAMARFLWEEFGWRSLVIVPKKGLSEQTVNEFRKAYGNDLKVGMLADGRRVFGDVIVATAATLLSAFPRESKGKKGKINRRPADPEVRAVLSDYEVLFLDETHHASAEGWYRISQFSKAQRRYGFSGTPLKDSELADLRMHAATGSILYEVKALKLITEGVVARPKIVMVMSDGASGPELPKGYRQRLVQGQMQPVTVNLPYQEAYTLGVVQNKHHNAAVVRASLWLVDRGKQTLVLCRKKEHWTTLRKMFTESGIEFMSVWGDTDIRERNKAKKLLDSGGIKLVLASTIWDEGEDVPGIDAVVLAEGVKVSTNSLQRVGRGMRKKKGDNEAWIIDFVPTNHPKLTEHALLRCQAYEGEGYDVTLLEDWPAPEVELEDDSTLLPFTVKP